MYSDMSMRTIASWLSNMNSASARASSVLPTPVGPRNRNVPIGRSGSWRPARERRSALATASTASSWPITRWCRRSSMWTSFSTSPSSRRETGMPVHLATTSATSSASTSSLRNGAPPSAALRCRLQPPPAALELGDLAVAQLGGALEVGLALGPLDLAVRLLEALLAVADRRDRVLLAPATAPSSRPTARAARRARARSPRAAPRTPRRVSFASACSSISSCMMRRSTSSISVGIESISMRSARGRLVDQVDRLVGQEAVGDVAVRERRRGDDRRVLDAHAVVDLVALLEAAQDRDRVLRRRARRRAPAGSGARAPRPSRCACGTRRAWWRRRRAARRARAWA